MVVFAWKSKVSKRRYLRVLNLCVCVGDKQSSHAKNNVRVVAGVRFLGSEGRICFSGVAGVKSCRVDPNVRIEGNSSSPLHLMISRTCLLHVCFERKMT